MNTEIEVVREATTGDAAIWQALTNAFDVMLLDIKMLGCDGGEVREQVEVSKA